MLSLISFILVCIGSINWFCIGILQFDFVAGLFGSQSNIFSRLIYTLVGVASIIVIANFVTNKGKFVVSLKKANKEYNEYKEEKKEENIRRKKALAAESAEEFNTHKQASNINNNSFEHDNYQDKLEAAKDNAHTENKCEHYKNNQNMDN